MKTMNFKIYSLLISIFALLTFSGCGSSSSPGQPAGETEAECLLNAGGYVAIDINGRTWLDRNLGASQAATDVNDSAAYGDYYQWGRYADGHQEWNSTVCTDLATDLNDSNDSAWYGQFILPNQPAPGPWDWVNHDLDVDDNGSLRSASWSTPYDDNQVCPCGYVVASEQDFKDLNITDANVSALFKLANAGWRTFSTGALGGQDTDAILWTSDTNGTTGSIPYSLTTDQRVGGHQRAMGHPIRCIKPQP